MQRLPWFRNDTTVRFMKTISKAGNGLNRDHCKHCACETTSWLSCILRGCNPCPGPHSPHLGSVSLAKCSDFRIWHDRQELEPMLLSTDVIKLHGLRPMLAAKGLMIRCTEFCTEMTTQRFQGLHMQFQDRHLHANTHISAEAVHIRQRAPYLVTCSRCPAVVALLRVGYCLLFASINFIRSSLLLSNEVQQVRGKTGLPV